MIMPMTSEQFANTYFHYQHNIEKILRKHNIFDEDLLHDTYIALYEHSQKAEIRHFVNSFVAFYRTRYMRREEKESYYESCDDTTMIEKYDRIDEDDWKRRERQEQSVDYIFEKYYTKPLPRAKDYERTAMVAQLYREGLTYREIANRMGVDVAAVYRRLKRSVSKIKSQQEMATI